MKITTVSLSRTIPTGPYMNDKIGMEATLEPGESEFDALHALSGRIERWHKENNPHLSQENQPPPIPERPFAYRQETTPVIDYGKHDASPDGILADIQKAQTLEELATYKLLAGKEGLVSQYVKRVNELTLI